MSTCFLPGLSENSLKNISMIYNVKKPSTMIFSSSHHFRTTNTLFKPVYFIFIKHLQFAG